MEKLKKRKKKTKRFITSAKLSVKEEYSDAYRILKSSNPNDSTFKFKK